MKKENSTLRKKLLAYSAIAGSVIAGGTADAQVVYFDVMPDKVLDQNNETQKVDLNGDLTSDFQVKYRKAASFNFGFILPYAMNSIAASVSTYNSHNIAHPYKLYCGELINDGLNWVNVYDLVFQSSNGASVLYYPIMGLKYNGGYYYNWAGGVVDGALAVRLSDGTNVNYGWIRCDFSADMKKLTVKDWAFEKTPNKAINACSSFGTGIASLHSNSGITIYAFEKKVMITSTVASSEPMNIVITDMSGKTMMTDKSNDNEIRLDLSNLSNGMYLVSVQQAEVVKTNLVSIR